MMIFTWQDVIALAAVAGAVLLVVRHLRRAGTRKKPTGCGSCVDCRAEPPQAPLVSIDPPRKR